MDVLRKDPDADVDVTTDADATTLSGLSYFCAAAVDAEMAMAHF